MVQSQSFNYNEGLSDTPLDFLSTSNKHDSFKSTNGLHTSADLNCSEAAKDPRVNYANLYLECPHNLLVRENIQEVIALKVDVLYMREKRERESTI